MDPIIESYLNSLEMGEVQVFKNMGVVPLFTPADESPEYLTLKEALEKNLLKITEVSQSGSVPELKVLNSADIPVLLLDGEELAGAKQNRVLNTSILLKEKSETVIPVSCTEQRRWSYVSDKFQESGTVMTPKLRATKAQTVATSLESSHQYRSDQGTVWDTIHNLSADAAVRSQTGAMKDVFEAKKADLEAYVATFKAKPKQKGLFVFSGGQVVGFDLVSSAKAYSLLHDKLVKSYAMEAILEKAENVSAPDRAQATAFLGETKACAEKKYESVGKGWDYRYEGRLVVGSGLAVEEKVIHLAFFRITESEKAGLMAGLRRRKGFRI
jgi:hypothetical protein